MPVDLSFTSRHELERWLERKNYESGSPKAFDEWLQDFFDGDNSISVRDEEWDYMACRELV